MYISPLNNIISLFIAYNTYIVTYYPADTLTLTRTKGRTNRRKQKQPRTQRWAAPPRERMTGRLAPCITCGKHISRQQKSWKCAGCSSLAHAQCTEPILIRGSSYLHCCSSPLRSTNTPTATTFSSSTAIVGAELAGPPTTSRDTKRKPSPSRSPSSQK